MAETSWATRRGWSRRRRSRLPLAHVGEINNKELLAYLAGRLEV